MLWFQGGCCDTVRSRFKKAGQEVNWAEVELRGAQTTDDTDKGAAQLTQRSMGELQQLFQQFIQSVCSV